MPGETEKTEKQNEREQMNKMNTKIAQLKCCREPKNFPKTRLKLKNIFEHVETVARAMNERRVFESGRVAEFVNYCGNISQNVYTH